jgi:DNA-binding NarL/FixJ family response regulator
VIRILLADDHTLVRQGLRRILEEQPGWQVVAETGNGLDAVKLASDLQPDVVILDIGMPQLNGLEAARQIAKKLPAARVLILSMHADEVHITKAIEAGAVGYLVKDSADTELVRAVTATAEGKSYFSPAAAAVLLGEYRRSLARRGVTDRYELLSDREREVLQLMAEGHSSKSIAAVLGISPATVETHRSHVFEKLDLHSIAEAVLYAVRRGLIS